MFDKTQGVQNVQRYVCGVFGLKSDDVRVMSPFVGGAFGSGLRPQYQVVLAVQGALQLKRAVRLVLASESDVRPRLSAGDDRARCDRREGRWIAGRDHPRGDRHDIAVRGILPQRHLVVGICSTRVPMRNTSTSLSRLDVPTPSDMRAPGAATGVYALECAMDELAVALKLDPVELRMRCYSDRDQNNDLPFTSKQLKECYRKGAELFGWAKRTSEPRSMRDGTDLVGWGMATGVWEALQMPMGDRIVLTANGHAEVSCATSDIGTGTYTIMAQVAADVLGLPIDNVTVKLGDSSLPHSRSRVGHGRRLRWRMPLQPRPMRFAGSFLRLAQKMPDSPLAGLRHEDVVLSDGMIVARQAASRAVSLAEAMQHGGVDRIVHERSAEFPEDTKHARNTHSAIFAEVKVDEQLGVIRVTRVVNAVAAGRIINTKTAASQVMGSVVWGIGMALHEEALVGSQLRSHHERQHRRISCAGERRRAGHQGHLRRRAGQHR